MVATPSSLNPAPEIESVGEPEKFDEPPQPVVIVETEEIKPEDSDAPIHDLELSIRSENCLLRGGIQTIGELLSKSREELLKIRNLGKISLKEILDRLEVLGYELKPSEPDSEAEAPEEKEEAESVEAKSVEQNEQIEENEQNEQKGTETSGGEVEN